MARGYPIRRSRSPRFRDMADIAHRIEIRFAQLRRQCPHVEGISTRLALQPARSQLDLEKGVRPRSDLGKRMPKPLPLALTDRTLIELTRCWRKPDSNLYGAFLVKWCFSVIASSLFNDCEGRLRWLGEVRQNVGWAAAVILSLT